MKFIYCGFDFFDLCLSECLSQGHELIGAFTQKVDGVYNTCTKIQALCSSQGVHYQERKITAMDIIDFQKLGCELLITAAFQYRIPSDALNEAGIMGLNIHPSLLPDGRGPWPLPWLILKGLPQGGVTLHKLQQSFDSGEILLQQPFAIENTDNLETLSFKSRVIAAVLMREFLREPNRYWGKSKIQGGGSYWPMPSEAERSLDWNMPVEHILRIVRAFGKFESYANFDGVDWLVQDATVWRESHQFTPGTVVQRTNREVLIAALDGFVCVRQFVREPEK